jgi:hypothetical protein
VLRRLGGYAIAVFAGALAVSSAFAADPIKIGFSMAQSCPLAGRSELRSLFASRRTAKPGRGQHERRRAADGGALARALMGEPKIVLIDEPSVGFGPIVVKLVIDAIAELKARLNRIREQSPEELGENDLVQRLYLGR